MKKVNINTIRMNKNNPRIIRDEKYRKLLKSIQEFPEMLEKRPLVCETALDGKYVVLGGNMRLKACNEAGMEMIPIELADDWSTEQKRQFIVKDNVGYGDWDFSLLSSEYELQELEEWGLDMPNNDYSEKNKEIDIEQMNEDLHNECPKCGFKY